MMYIVSLCSWIGFETNIEEQKKEKQKLFDILHRVQSEWQPKTEFELELHQLFFEDSDLHIEGPLNCNRFVYFPPQLNFDNSEEPESQCVPDDCLMEDITLLPPTSDGSPTQQPQLATPIKVSQYVFIGKEET